MNRLLILISVLILILGFNATLSADNKFIVSSSGLEYKDLKVGDGPEAEIGQTAVIHFVGWLSDKGQRGKELYNSRKEKKSVSFLIGTDNVMEGWNEGVVGMRKGGTRMLRMPPKLAYGAKSVEGVIPPNAPLIFIIELVDLR